MIRIQPYTSAALPGVVALSLRAWTPVFESLERAMDPQVFRHFYPEWRDVQARAVEAACTSEEFSVWIATYADAIAGFVAVKLHRDSGMGEVHMVAVDPPYQGKGIARALMDRAVEWMRASGMSIAMVETGGDPGHAAARSVYERLGFRNLPVARYFKKL